MKVWECIKSTVAERAMHFSLIDPTKQPIDRACEIAKKVEEAGSDLILIGCSVGLGRIMDEYIKAIKSEVSLPVVVFPNSLDSVSPYMDAMLLLSLVNSNSPYWITTLPAQIAVAAKRAGKEVISSAYIIVEPGMLVGWVADAKPLLRYKPELAGFYALYAEAFGFKLFHMDVGSGAPEPVPVEMVKTARRLINLPIVIGGGIRTPQQAGELVKAGADILITGNILEHTKDVSKTVSEITEAIHKTERIIVK